MEGVSVFDRPGSLLCFSCSSHQDTIESSLHLTHEASDVISNCNVSTYLDTSGNVIYTTFIRLPGATRAFLGKVDEIARNFAGNVLIADSRMDERAFRAARIPFKQNYFVIESATELEVILNVVMTDAQRAHIQRSVFERQRSMGVAGVERHQQLPPNAYRQNHMVDAFHRSMDDRGAPAPLPPGFMGGADIVMWHDEPHLSVGRSMNRERMHRERMPRQNMEQMMFDLMRQESENMTQPRRQRDPMPMPTGWEDVLREPEPLLEGYPECLICMDKRATILYLECGHLTTCDACARRMAEDKRECPLCPGILKTKIMRPVTSTPTKKKRKSPEPKPKPKKKKKSRRIKKEGSNPK
jgi:hypothetical protein